jgi:hypothetical protein
VLAKCKFGLSSSYRAIFLRSQAAQHEQVAENLESIIEHSVELHCEVANLWTLRKHEATRFRISIAGDTEETKSNFRGDWTGDRNTYFQTRWARSTTSLETYV